ncbi:hypothetical protein [Nonomuraea sp. NPDC005692]|uniref:hypothetical protein n=1 Tax=Nonomuraea sp. NPDC005692 TaxID=3157168 RepID=UPI0033F7D38C
MADRVISLEARQALLDEIPPVLVDVAVPDAEVGVLSMPPAACQAEAHRWRIARQLNQGESLRACAAPFERAVTPPP